MCTDLFNASAVGLSRSAILHFAASVLCAVELVLVVVSQSQCSFGAAQCLT